jgi:hypothetical protein
MGDNIEHDANHVVLEVQWVTLQSPNKIICKED